jgi:hypothetical protein
MRSVRVADQRIVRSVRFKIGSSFETFCAETVRRVSNQLLSYLVPLFPHEVIAAIAGHVDRLNTVCLCYLIQAGFDRADEFTGDGAVMATKLFPRMRDRALALIEGDNPPEAALVRVMLRHLNPAANQFVVDGWLAARASPRLDPDESAQQSSRRMPVQ